MMFLVRLIDVFVGIMLFLFRGERRDGSNTPLALGAIGIVVLVVGLLVTIGLPKGIYLMRTHPYAAEMANASGLSGGDPVYVAGVPAGRVEKISLAGDHVRVAFRLDHHQPLGDRTTATVRLKTVLGKRYLDVVPAGVTRKSEDDIPLSRTSVPYSFDDVSAAAADAGTNLDEKSLAAALTTLRQTLPGDPDDLSKALAGISAVTGTFARNGSEVDQLLAVSRKLADLASAQTDSITQTAGNAQTIIRTLVVRKDALSQLVDNLTSILGTLSKSFTANQQVFGQMVANLVRVTDTLKQNVGQIDLLLTRLPSSLRKVTDATGNGDWADVTAPAAVLPDNLLCAIGVMGGCR